MISPEVTVPRSVAAVVEIVVSVPANGGLLFHESTLLSDDDDDVVECFDSVEKEDDEIVDVEEENDRRLGADDNKDPFRYDVPGGDVPGDDGEDDDPLNDVNRESSIVGSSTDQSTSKAAER